MIVSGQAVDGRLYADYTCQVGSVDGALAHRAVLEPWAPDARASRARASGAKGDYRKDIFSYER